MKLFGTDGIRGKAGQYPINSDFAADLGRAAVTFAAKGENAPKIVVARDTRVSGIELQNALVAGIIDAGGEALLLGILPTNAVSFAVQHEKADLGVMISASHNPADENGFKVFGNDGVKLSEGKEEKIEHILFSKKFRAIGAGPKEQSLESYRAYKKNILNSADAQFQGLKVIFDAANGSASFIADEIFKQLGIDTEVINNKPSGVNINKDCGALHPEGMAIGAAQRGADIGVAVDGDADRAIFCDENGKILDGDQYMAIIASELNKQKLLKKNTIVVTAYSNTALDEAMKKEGIKVVRVANGDRYVLEEMLKNGYNFGGEKSGHYIFLDYAKGGDGILSALQLLKIMKETGKKLSELAALKPYPQLTANVKIKEKKPFEKLELMALAKALEAKISGRIFIRYSGTENLLRIMAEGRNEKELKAAMAELEAQAKKELN